jgi:hypothetical protein
MGKIQITELAKELDYDIDKLIGLKMKKLGAEHFKGNGKNTWLTDEGADLLRLAVQVPLAVPNRLMGMVLHEARNPRWVFVKIDGKEGKHPVLIHRRYYGRMIGKRIAINQITDNKGTTYTHNADKS